VSNKKRNKEIRAKHALKLEIAQNPDWCWCKENLGLDPDVDYDKDKVIGETEPIDGFPYWNSTGFTQPLYLCKRCGKKHAMIIVFA